MKLVRVDKLFEVEYGTNLALNKLEQVENGGVPFVSRTSINNGVSAYVSHLDGVETNPPHTLSVAGGGSVLSTFYQKNPYYSGRDLYYLVPDPELELGEKEMLVYARLIEHNKYRYCYGRQANRTLKELKIPHPDGLPNFIDKLPLIKKPSNESYSNKELDLSIKDWSDFNVGNLFDDVSLGKPIHKNSIKNSSIKNSSIKNKSVYIPYVTRTTKDNGIEMYIDNKVLNNQNYIQDKNCITIGAEGFKAFYQKDSFATGNKVNILRSEYLNLEISLFLNCILNFEIEKKFGYGRGLVKSRIVELSIKLPTKNNQPDWQFMEDYIKSLPYSKSL